MNGVPFHLFLRFMLRVLLALDGQLVTNQGPIDVAFLHSWQLGPLTCPFHFEHLAALQTHEARMGEIEMNGEAVRRKVCV
jgi:hypothetical protein